MLVPSSHKPSHATGIIQSPRLTTATRFLELSSSADEAWENKDDLSLKVELPRADELTLRVTTSEGDHFTLFYQNFINDFDLGIISLLGYVGDDASSSAWVDELSADLALAITESTEEAKRRAAALQVTQVATEEPQGATQEVEAIVEAAPTVAEQVAAEEPERQPEVQSEATQVQEVEPAAEKEIHENK